MATAVQTSQPQPAGSEPRSANPSAQLLVAGLLGAVFLLAAVAVAGYAVPVFWQQYAAPVVAPAGTFVNVFLRVALQVAAVAALVVVGSRLGGANPPDGVRGSIFLWVSALIAAFYVARAIGLNAGPDSGPMAFGIAMVALVAAAWYGLGQPRAVGLMHAIEHSGLLTTHSYKRTQGQRVRRYTLIGLLIVGLSGVYTAYTHLTFGSGTLRMRMPFLVENGDFKSVPVVDFAQLSIPIVMAAAVLWVSWRAVNMPLFGDFLIATEAEMNKVSWSTRKRLTQDTAVVLVTTVLLTLFLLGVDLFWGWLLSRQTIGVLPPQVERKADPQGTKTEW